jgi:acyl carrier protein
MTSPLAARSFDYLEVAGVQAASDAAPAAAPAAHGGPDAARWQALRRLKVAQGALDGGDLLLVEEGEGLAAAALRAAALRSGEFEQPPAVMLVAQLPSPAQAPLELAGARQEAVAGGCYHAYEAPRSPLQRRLVDALQRLLGIAPIGITDDFYALGLDSVAAIQLSVAIETLVQRPLSLEELFEQGNVGALAARLEAGASMGAG